jgi:CheY-like chemotaxis protein
MSSLLPRKNILVVDDNPGDLGLIRQVLENLRGIDLEVVHSVLQAHAFLNRMPPFVTAPVPDLVFLDLRMPMLPGHNVIPLIKRDPNLQHVKIVVFTSSSLSKDRIQCDGLGADDFVVKPCDWDQWQATITHILARHGILVPG